MSLIFVDVEATYPSPCPGIGQGMSEFGACEFKTRATYHGIFTEEPWRPVACPEIKKIKAITDEYIEAQRTPRGGWTRETLALWGVPWPPPPGWKRAILEHGIPYQAVGLRIWTAAMWNFESYLHRFPPPYVFVTDNVAWDWQWINFHFWKELNRNPFGHSARRIGDFFAGLKGDFRKTQEWKRWRKPKHDHNPVHDAMGNAEAFAEMLRRFGADGNLTES